MSVKIRVRFRIPMYTTQGTSSIRREWTERYVLGINLHALIFFGTHPSPFNVTNTSLNMIMYYTCQLKKDRTISIINTIKIYKLFLAEINNPVLAYFFKLSVLTSLPTCSINTSQLNEKKYYIHRIFR